MFNYHNRSALSEFTRFGEVRTDGEFFGVAKISTTVPNRLVPIASQNALAAAQSERDISGLIVAPELAEQVPDRLPCMINQDPIRCAHDIHKELVERKDYYWTDFPSRIAASAAIGAGAQIASVNVIIGENCVVEPNAVVMERSIVGNGVHIGALTVVGAKAFELIRIEGRNSLYPHAGGVRIAEGTIILSGTMLVKSAFAAFTEIREHVVVDNLVHVAHDCDLGAGTRVVACALLGGRAEFGENSYVGPNATVSNGLVIGAGATISIGATVTQDVPPGQRVTGNFAIDHQKFLSNLRAQR